MPRIDSLSPHVRPPDNIREVYKKYQRLPLAEIDSDKSILDLQSLDPDDLPPGISLPERRSSKDLRCAFDQFIQGDCSLGGGPLLENVPVFTHQSVSGQHVILQC